MDTIGGRKMRERNDRLVRAVLGDAIVCDIDERRIKSWTMKMEKRGRSIANIHVDPHLLLKKVPLRKEGEGAGGKRKGEFNRSNRSRRKSFSKNPEHQPNSSRAVSHLEKEAPPKEAFKLRALTRSNYAAGSLFCSSLRIIIRR